MKALRTLLVLIPVLAVVMMLAGMLDLMVVFRICTSGLSLVLFVAGGWAMCLLMAESKKRFATPAGWGEAQTLYPLREPAGGTRIRCFVREDGRGKFFLCWLRPGEDGVLITDAQPFLSFGKLLVPWEALDEPREVDLPWHARYASLWWRDAVVESGIRDTNLSLVVLMAIWTREFVPHVPSD